MELKEGMYVRTKYNDFCNCVVIRKIDEIDEDDNKFWIDEDVFDTYGDEQNIICEEDVQKASFNTLELLEVGDLLKIEYYSLRYDERVERLFEVTYKDNRNIALDNKKMSFLIVNNEFNDKDKKFNPIIKSIVTKEMYSNVEYRVETN